ncbi:hypothetical protein [Streptomyces beijiangensis]|uniref:Uncharacterized protein n=1 Tax=Streptomyces beijiangensis TaxID=163361 RepID=A0A939FA89_9ACTN|nr:hypothetical protein [Streptomyces beijiangensis]MBO0515290.1 hypothetical protein [Streptomyces beijiangensis]
MTHPYPERLQQEGAQLAEHSRGFLLPGESLVAAFGMRLDQFVPEVLPRRYRTPKPEADAAARLKGGWRLLNPVIWVMYVVSVPAGLGEAACSGTWRGIRRLFRGKVWHGGWESGAGHFVRAVRTGPSYSSGHGHKSYVLTVTDRRLLLLTTSSTVLPRPAQLLGELPRGQFARRRASHPPRHKDRVDIAFTDGSWVALEAERRIQVEQIASLLG